MMAVSVQIGLHLVLLLAAGRAAGFSQRDLLLASNANVGGASIFSDATEPLISAERRCSVAASRFRFLIS
jgi:hypothetical protein